MAFFIRQLSIDLGISDERTVNLTQKHIRGRLAESLLFLKDSYGLKKTVLRYIYLAREDLANHIQYDTGMLFARCPPLWRNVSLL